MKKLKTIAGLAIITLLCSFVVYEMNNYRFIPNNVFFPGEVINYRVHFGFIDAGVAEMVISDELEYINGRACHKIDVHGKSTGMFDFFMHLDDLWSTYLDTAAIIPHRFYRILEEGNFKKYEIVDYDHLNKKVIVKNYSYKRKYWVGPEEFDIPVNAHDMVSGYYFTRLIDFDTLSPGDILNIPGFLEDKVYHLQVRYLGKERLKTKIGTMSALVMSPIVPENTLFDGENSIKFWLSDDEKKLPLKIRAAMFLGAVEVDITDYKPGRN
ncbi:MAG: DUF3108 domain-containing protein [Cyclobacteriaceae bacterium]|nr:DUF3108 domain-containing protein [Cyclobacteriaceae bacterium]